MKRENIIRDKSYSFALRIIKLNQMMVNDLKEYVLSKQILKAEHLSEQILKRQLVASQIKILGLNCSYLIKRHEKHTFGFAF